MGDWAKPVGVGVAARAAIPTPIPRSNSRLQPVGRPISHPLPKTPAEISGKPVDALADTSVWKSAAEAGFKVVAAHPRPVASAHRWKRKGFRTRVDFSDLPPPLACGTGRACPLPPSDLR